MPESRRPLVSNFNEDIRNDERAREAVCQGLLQMEASSRKAAMSRDVDLERILKDGEDYYRNRQDIKGKVKYNEFRCSVSFSNIWTKLPILTANRPRYDFEARQKIDWLQIEMYNNVDDWHWEMYRIFLKYRLAQIDMMKFSVGFLHCEDRWDGESTETELDVTVPLLHNVLVADWCMYSLQDQPYVIITGVEDYDVAKDRWFEVADKIKPGDDGQHLGFLDRMWQNIKDLRAFQGVAVDQMSTFNTANIKNNWYNGKVPTMLIYQKKGKRILKSYVVNGVLAEHKFTDLKEYPLFCARDYPNNGRFLGTSEIDLTRYADDAITASMQAILFHLALFGRGIWEYPKRLMSSSKFEALLNKGGGAIGVPDRYYGKAIVPHFPQGLPAGHLDNMRFQKEITDNATGLQDWIKGSVAPGEDPASKTVALQQAGLARPKIQAQFNDDDMLWNLGRHMLFRYQRRDTKHKVMQIFGEFEDDGSPRFIETNIEIDKILFQMLSESASKGWGLMTQNMTITPQQLRKQIEYIKKRVLAPAAAKNGQILDLKLFDTSLGEFGVSVRNSDTLPYDEQMRNASVDRGIELGANTLKEWREVRKWPTNPAIMKQLRGNVPMLPPQELAQMLQAAMQDPQAAPEILQQILQYIQTLQEAVGK